MHNNRQTEKAQTEARKEKRPYTPIVWLGGKVYKPSKNGGWILGANK